MISATELRKGMVIRVDDEVFNVLAVEYVIRERRRGFVQTKLRNVRTGLQSDKRFRSTDKVELVHVDQREMEYIYDDADNIYVMDLKSYEQIPIAKQALGDDIKFLKPNTMVKVNYYDGQPINVELPTTVDLKVIYTEPHQRGATVTNVYKPATLETGAVVQVPPFISVGEIIRIDTRDGHYVERVKEAEE
jgi:elongation factor P